MNRKQLDAMLAAGVITAEDHRRAVASIQAGVVTDRPALALSVGTHVKLAEADEDAEARTIVGDPITAYDTVINSHQLVLHSGCFEPRERVMLLRDHDHRDPVGLMTEIDATATRAVFSIPEGENGDRALAEAANGLRAGLSVGFTAFPDGYYFDEDWVLHVTRADLYEVSLCAIPAVPTAGVTNVAAALANAKKEKTTMKTREQLAAALAAGEITQQQHDAQLAVIVADEAAAQLAATPPAPAPQPGAQPAAANAPPAGTEAAALAAGPADLGPVAPPVQVQDAKLSLRQVAERLAAAANTGNPAALQLALVDVLPAQDEGQAFIGRPDWIGELFNARQVERPWVDSFGVPAQLDSIKTKGYRVTERPTVAKYAGNKTEVPASGTFKTEPVEFDSEMWAGGWDIERRLVDLADPGFIEWFWGLAMDDYKTKSDADIATKVLAIMNRTTNKSTITGGVIDGVLALYRGFRAVKGSKLDRIKLGADLFDEYVSLKKDQLPHWLDGATTGAVNLQEGSFDAGSIHVEYAPEMGAREIGGFDSRAGKVREKSPIEVRAFDVARGGIDLGFYSYGLFEEHDPRLFRKVTVTAPAAN